MKNIVTSIKELIKGISIKFYKVRLSVKVVKYEKDIKHIKYFRMSERDYGKRLLYIVTLNDEKYTYEHDYVYNMLIDKYKKKDCWKTYKYYSNTNNIPKDALKYVSKI